jgi:hypothetical protein
MIMIFASLQLDFACYFQKDRIIIAQSENATLHFFSQHSFYVGNILLHITQAPMDTIIPYLEATHYLDSLLFTM